MMQPRFQGSAVANQVEGKSSDSPDQGSRISVLLHRCYYSGLEFICDALCRVDFHSCGQRLQCMLIYCNKRIFYMRKESWGQFVEFPDSYFACSRRSDRRAREKNSRRKKNKGRLDYLPPLPVFPVYNLTRSPTI